MRKLILAIICVCCATGAYATGENERVTSMGYVTEELDTRQDKFQKLGADTAITYSGTTDGAVGSRTITGDLGAESNNSSTAIPTVGAVDAKLENKQDELDFAANTVLMNTGTAGEPTAKGIYQSSGDYNSQTDSLVDAATFNAALQNAINSELSCAQRKDPNDPNSKCLLFNIFAPTQNRIIPAEYTRLEYISTGNTVSVNNPYINSGVNLANGVKLELDIKFNNSTKSQYNGTYAQETRLDVGLHYSGKFVMNYGATNITDITADTARHTFIIDTYNLYWSIDNHRENYPTNITVNNSPIYIGGRQDSGGDLIYTHTAENIYSAKIYMNNSIVRNFIPAKRNSDGKVGLYDTVTNTFFTNIVTSGNDFIAGPELSSNIYLPMN